MDRGKLADLLNEDLAHELRAIAVYLHQYATATGLRGHELRELIEPEIASELEHAKFLADKIVALGGSPRLTLPAFEEKADVRDMIAYDLELERQAVAAYTERAEQARQCGEVGLAVQLENMVAEETGHKEMLERLLRGFVELERT